MARFLFLFFLAFTYGINNLSAQCTSTSTVSINVDATSMLESSGVIKVTASLSSANSEDIHVSFTFDGTAENDSSIALTGGTAGDTLTGTDTTTKGDTIKGNGGADTIDGSKGGDTLTGGAGADIFTYNAIADSNTGAKDSITDFLSGTDGLAVTLDYSSSTQDLTITGDVEFILGKVKKNKLPVSLSVLGISVTYKGSLIPDTKNAEDLILYPFILFI